MILYNTNFIKVIFTKAVSYYYSYVQCFILPSPDFPHYTVYDTIRLKLVSTNSVELRKFPLGGISGVLSRMGLGAISVFSLVGFFIQNMYQKF